MASEKAGTHMSAKKHAVENRPSIQRQADAGKGRRENPMPLVLLVRRGITAGKTRRTLCMQQQRQYRFSDWRPIDIVTLTFDLMTTIWMGFHFRTYRGTPGSVPAWVFALLWVLASSSFRCHQSHIAVQCVGAITDKFCSIFIADHKRAFSSPLGVTTHLAA